MTTVAYPLAFPARRYLLVASPPRNPGLGQMEWVGSIFNTVFGGIFGSKERREQRRQEERIFQMQADLQREEWRQQAAFGEKFLEAQRAVTTEEIGAQKWVAERQAVAQEKAIAAGLTAARDRSRAELQAIKEQYQAQLDSVRMWRGAQADQAISDLVAQTTGGIFDLASQGLLQTGRAVVAFPKAGSLAITATAFAGILALALLGRKKPLALSFRRSPRRRARRRTAESFA